MGELFVRLRRHPAATMRLLLASLVVNVLGLASSLYVIQVLNRYVSHGVAATLATLIVGALIALAGEHAFRVLRQDLALEILGEEAEAGGGAEALFGLLLTARLSALRETVPAEREGVVRDAERAEAVFGAGNLSALSDLPFSLMFLLALLLLSPPLAGIAALFMAILALVGWLGQKRLTAPMRAAQVAAGRMGALLAATSWASESIRQFGGASLLKGRWQAALTDARAAQASILRGQTIAASATQIVQALMGIVIIALGAMLVVDGKLDVGALIGANLIAGRALAPIVRLVHLGGELKKAEENLAAARALATSLPTEPDQGLIPRHMLGRIELREIGLSPAAAALTIAIAPGSVVAITGGSGTGKTWLTAVLAGLADPGHGQVLIDGIDLRQISPVWWRQQVSYMPQEPVFLDGSLKENFLAARPDLGTDDMRRSLEAVGLGRYVDEHPEGLEQMLAGGGRFLPSGIRRRLGLARALAVDGPLAVLDEPSKGLDEAGTKAVYALLVDMAKRGKTLVIATHDANILRGATQILSLGKGARA